MGNSFSKRGLRTYAINFGGARDRLYNASRGSYSEAAKVGRMERSADWMDEAQGDLKHARSDVQGGFYNWACFSSQQAAEKAIKAVFQRMGAEAWGHSVADLLEELSKHRPVSEGLMNGALELDKAYIPAHYPNAHPSGSPRSRYTAEEAKRLISYAQEIIEFCTGLLSEARPD